MRKKIAIGLGLAALVAGPGAGAAGAAPFLCPVVGDGVINADARNGDNGVAAITPPVGTSLLPGNNQAATNANPQAYNTLGPSDPNAGPGGNPDFSPIWPG
jgi:hypothetical protein